MSEPACSVVIPTRNCIDYLPTALASVALQNRRDLEIIVVDDGSTDGSGAWLANAKDRLPNLIVLQGEGKGPAVARNRAIGAARAPLIAFLDADDWWWPNKLASQIAHHEATPEAGFSFTDYLHVGPEGESRGTCFEYWRSDVLKRTSGAYSGLPGAEAELLARNIVGTSTVVARKAALERVGGFSVEKNSAEDWDMWLKLAAIAPVSCSKAVTATYLMRPASETSKKQHRIDAIADLIRRYEAIPARRIRRALMQTRARRDAALAELAAQNGEYMRAAGFHSRAFLAAPSPRLGKAATANVLMAARKLLSSRKQIA